MDNKYGDVTVTIKKSPMRRFIGGKCNHCSTFQTAKTLDKHCDLCEHCYYEETIVECESCGREISSFEYINSSGLCEFCDEWS